MIYKILLFIGVVFNVLAQLSLKKGMNEIGTVEMKSGILFKIREMFLNPFFIFGIIFYGLGFLSYAIVLSKIELGKAFPVSSVSAIVLIFLLSVIFLNESLNITKIIGIIFCILGIIFIFR